MSGWMLNNWVIKWQMKINVNKYRGIHRGRSKSNYPYAMTSCKIAHRKKKIRWNSCASFLQGSAWGSAVVKKGARGQEWIRKGRKRRTTNALLVLKGQNFFMLGLNESWKLAQDVFKEKEWVLSEVSRQIDGGI